MTSAAAPGRKSGEAVTFDGLLRRHATQATTALSVVVGITGVMMFFHVAKTQVEAMHEWLGMGFVLVALLHAVRHRAGLANMMGQARMYVALGAAALSVAGFLALAPAKQGNPVHQMTDRVMKAPIAQVAPVLGLSASELAARMGTDDTSLSMAAIASERGIEPPRLLATALAK